jgi:oligopeptide transport system ATP-binding protein
LAVVDLSVRFHLPEGIIRAAEGVSFDILRGEVVAMVGESGSGKTVTGLAAMRLIPTPPGEIVRGSILLDGEDILTKSPAAMRAIRGKRIGMIFQNPFLALNPLINIGDQLTETLRLHVNLSRGEVSAVVESLLIDLGIGEPKRILNSRPHQASGGTNQRVMLALALLGKPELLIADEPTTMLDAITQADIFHLMLKLRAERKMSIWLITHDFGAVALMADRVVVMYAGTPVEWSDTKTIIHDPKHPYTIGLIGSVPPMGRRAARLLQMPGEPPDLLNIPKGCPFAPRCPKAMSICRTDDPPVVRVPDGTNVRCWLHSNAGSNR